MTRAHTGLVPNLGNRKLSVNEDAHAAADGPVALIVDAIIENGGKTRLTLRQFELVCGLSAAHLGRLFKKATGASFHRYMREKRMEAAVQLLHNKELAIKEIASILGYTDVSNFSADFRAVIGTTPARFRFGGRGSDSTAAASRMPRDASRIQGASVRESDTV